MAVIGAGPAGSEFAYRMAKAGFKVIVLEKGSLNREKPCGGGIPVQEAAEFGALPYNIVERSINTARIVSPKNEVLEMALKSSKKTGSIVRREVYDSFLQKRAADAGAVLVRNCNVRRIRQRNSIVEVFAGRKRYLARIAADASGFPCSIKGISREVSDDDIVATFHVWMKMPGIGKRIGNAIEMYCGKNVVPKGYAWIFPKKDVVSVGIGTMKSAIKSERLSLKKLLFSFIKKHPVASKKLQGGRIIKSGGGLIPVALLERLYSGNVVFIGDAGGFANPLHAGGIYQARKSAVIAAKHCMRFLRARNVKEKSRALEGYDKEARAIFNDRTSRWDIKIRNLFWNDELLSNVVKKAADDRRMKDAIGALLSMTMPHEKAYSVLEGKMLDIIHGSAAEKVSRYKQLVNKELGLFNKRESLDRLASYSFFGDAKRLRVSLVLLACDLFKGNLRKASKLAPVYELLHTASLVHDDIMDDSSVRRSKRTLHSIHGVNNAILAGDFLIGKTYGVLSKGIHGLSSAQTAAMLSVIGDSATKCCYGQLMDMELSKQRRYGKIDDYLEMARLKTGSMIEGAMKKGAVIADASAAEIRAAGRIGENIGIAFQIIDDSIDLLGTNGSKSMHNDLRQAKATPMLIHALKNMDGIERRFLLGMVGKKSISGKDAARIAGLYRKAGSIEYSQKLSAIYVGKARKELERLNNSGSINKKAFSVLSGLLDVMGYWGMMGE